MPQHTNSCKSCHYLRENFTKEKLYHFVLPLKKLKIDAAWKHASVKGPGQILNPPKIYRIPDQTK